MQSQALDGAYNNDWTSITYSFTYLLTYFHSTAVQRPLDW